MATSRANRQSVGREAAKIARLRAQGIISDPPPVKRYTVEMRLLKGGGHTIKLARTTDLDEAARVAYNRRSLGWGVYITDENGTGVDYAPILRRLGLLS